MVEGNEALKVWIFKALHTIRYKYIAYSTDYGCEITSLISSGINSEVQIEEIQRYIIEALMVNPYITQVTEFGFEMNKNIILITFICKSIYGEIQGGVEYGI